MLTLTLKKEWLEGRREGRTLWLSCIVLVLLACALLSSWHSYQQVQVQKQQVEKSERERWLEQGGKDPHSAAHYGVYVVKPDTGLSVLDPGLTDYQGVVLRLEAHKRNETLFRGIQDAIQMQRFGNLSPAFILQTLLPLLIILFGFHSVAAERESGTLKQLLANGLCPKRFFIAKTLSIYGFALLFFVPLVLYILFTLVFGSSITAYRSALFLISYGVYILIWVLLTLVISSYSRTARSALISLLVVWASTCLFLPKLAIANAESKFPTPSSQIFLSKLESEIYTPERQQAITKFKQDTLDEFGVKSVDELPFAWSGAQLQFGEQYADKVFDRLFGQRQIQLDAQGFHYQSAGILSPFIALQAISMSAAATDLPHHVLFSNAGEKHRRLMQEILNGDLKENGLTKKSDGESYQGDHQLWERIPEFSYQYPPIDTLAKHYGRAAIYLVCWLVLLMFLACLAVQRIKNEGK